MSKTAACDPSTQRVIMISSDGHACAKMEDYRPYIASEHHQAFDAFCVEFRQKGSRSVDPKHLLTRLDPEVVDTWQEQVIDGDRLGGISDTKLRFKEMARAGVAAEVIFPDFGLPFELYNKFLADTLGFRRSKEQVDIANYAYNRWLADF